MTDLNTKTIINLLPFDPKQKLELLESYDNLPIDEQIRITRVVWEAFEAYQDIKLKENFEKGLEQSDKNPDEIGKDYYTKVVEDTSNEITASLADAGQTVDLKDVRASMEKIVKEINAAKSQNTP